MKSFPAEINFARANDESFLLSCPGPLFLCCVPFPEDCVSC